MTPSMFVFNQIIVLGLVASLSLSFAAAEPLKVSAYNEFEIEFGSHGQFGERANREMNFHKSVQFINDFNIRSEDVVLEVNHLADLSEQEYSEWLGQSSTTAFLDSISNEKPLELNNSVVETPLPEKMDWRESGKVNPIRNQGACGACWAFATAATVESAYLIKHNLQLNLSVQELMDCGSNTKKYYNEGCKLGFTDVAFDYIHDNGLIEEKFYAYQAKDLACNNETRHKNPKYGINAYKIIPFNSTDEPIMRAIYEHGPVAAAMNADSSIFRFYSSGIIRNVMPGMIIPNHVVAIVGYETINGTDVWIIRNSWGTRWGYQGYAYVERHQNQMGLNNLVAYPLLK